MHARTCLRPPWGHGFSHLGPVQDTLAWHSGRPAARRWLLEASQRLFPPRHCPQLRVTKHLAQSITRPSGGRRPTLASSRPVHSHRSSEAQSLPGLHPPRPMPPTPPRPSLSLWGAKNGPSPPSVRCMSCLTVEVEGFRVVPASQAPATEGDHAMGTQRTHGSARPVHLYKTMIQLLKEHVGQCCVLHDPCQHPSENRPHRTQKTKPFMGSTGMLRPTPCSFSFQPHRLLLFGDWNGFQNTFEDVTLISQAETSL